MKYVSLVFIIGLMWWSWAVTNAPADLPESTHVGIQTDLRRVITEYIQQNVPNVRDIRFEKFWTQLIGKDQVKATFAYTFEEGEESAGRAARIGIDGHAILNHSKDDSGQYDLWSLDELYVLNNRIDFKDGVNIEADDTTQKNR